MNTTTINISLPLSLLKVARSESKKFGFASTSEYIRQAIRNFAYGIDKNGLTINGFTPEFEDIVLESAKESINESSAWTSTKDIDAYFKKLKTKNK